MTIRPPDDLYECAECSAKPGSPALCADCLRRRAEVDRMGMRWRGPRQTSIGYAQHNENWEAHKPHLPWEETWMAQGTRIEHEVDEGRGPSLGMFAGSRFSEWDLEHARLAAAAPEMARLLVEFLNLRCDGDWCGGCAGCRHPTPGHHSIDCKLAAVLRKAGVPQSSGDSK